jgi:hypothetical protein
MRKRWLNTTSLTASRLTSIPAAKRRTFTSNELLIAILPPFSYTQTCDTRDESFVRED